MSYLDFPSPYNSKILMGDGFFSSESFDQPSKVENKKNNQANNTTVPLTPQKKNNEKLENIQQEVERGETIEKAVVFVQQWVNDFIFKGIGNTSRIYLSSFSRMTDIEKSRLFNRFQFLNFVTDCFDTTAGVIKIVQQKKILNAAKNQLNKIKNNRHQVLSKEQLLRITRLEALIADDEVELSAQRSDEIMTVIKNGLSYLMYFFSQKSINLTAKFSLILQPLLIATDAIRYGIWYYQAHQNIKVHKAWSSNFLKNQKDSKVSSPSPTLANLKQKISENKITIQTIKNRMIKIKGKKWVDNQKDDQALILEYANYHKAVSGIAKKALAEMVKNKHEIEGKCLNFNRTYQKTHFYLNLALLITSVALTAIGLISTPFGGSALILLGLGGLSMAIGLGVNIAGYRDLYRLKPKSTFATFTGTPLYLYYYYARANLQPFQDKVNRILTTGVKKAGSKMSSILRRVPLIGRVCPNKNTKGSMKKKDSFKRKDQLLYWQQKGEQLQEKLDQMAWEDFVNYSKQKNSRLKQRKISHQYDLDKLCVHLSHCEQDLLSDEVKNLADQQLGINLPSLQKEIESNPLAFKKKIRNFFIMADPYYLKFIKQQNHIWKKTLV